MADRHFDAVVVGAGFAGMYMLYRLRKLGMSARVFESADGVGGTWYWNRYPGARCDVESVQYSYHFSEELQQEWCWSERYATQPEILRYANHVADRFHLRPDIEFDTTVTTVSWNDQLQRWGVVLQPDSGEPQRVVARFCIMATGCLSSPNTPRFEGLDDFAGQTYHTGNWPHEGVDFSGQRVGVIGTGSSAIQSIPVIAQQAQQLHVFQRTPNYMSPAHNRPLSDEEQAEVKRNYAALRARQRLSRNALAFRFPEKSAMALSPEDRQQEFESRWADGGLPFAQSFNDLLINPAANEAAAEFVRSRIRATVSDPETAELLMPRNTFGCKRLCVDSGYFETYNRSNVELVDVSRTPIERITRIGVVVNEATYELDALVLATGFDAMTGALLKIDIVGKHGQKLADKWAQGPRTYMGLAVAGFPNLFTITGPGSPSVLSNMLFSIQQHVDWITDCLEAMAAQQVDLIETTEEAEDGWADHVGELVGNTLYGTCNSWYLGANIPGKSRVFMPYPGVPSYLKKCEEVVAGGYRGFVMSHID